MWEYFEFIGSWLRYHGVHGRVFGLRKSRRSGGRKEAAISMDETATKCNPVKNLKHGEMPYCCIGHPALFQVATFLISSSNSSSSRLVLYMSRNVAVLSKSPGERTSGSYNTVVI